LDVAPKGKIIWQFSQVNRQRAEKEFGNKLVALQQHERLRREGYLHASKHEGRKRTRYQRKANEHFGIFLLALQAAGAYAAIEVEPVNQVL